MFKLGAVSILMWNWNPCFFNFWKFANNKILILLHACAYKKFMLAKTFAKTWDFFLVSSLNKMLHFFHFFKNRSLKVPDQLRYPFRYLIVVHCFLLINSGFFGKLMVCAIWKIITTWRSPQTQAIRASSRLKVTLVRFVKP